MISSTRTLSLFTLLFTLLLFTLMLGIFLCSIVADAEQERFYVRHYKTKNTLQLISVVIRHGDRAPLNTYPNDPYINNSMEPYGWGQLTDKGRKYQYNQGLFLRKRYDDFLGSIYHPDIFYLQSTAYDRTKMSGMLEAAALWKPNSKQMFELGLPWQPVTLHYQEFKKDTENMNLTLPIWTKNYYPDKLKPLYLLGERLYTYNDECRKLYGGAILKKIIADMKGRKQGTLPERRKMFMYLGHDITVVSLLNTMHIWYDQIPYYNIMIIIELHENEGKWNVQIFLRNTTAHEPYPMTIPGCTVACPLDKFVEILKPMIPDNWEEECKVNDSNYVIPPPPYL
ncbi:prostatic acid phosphatase isoform X2 [Monomorium pharaonis]|uniref:prostatic acid phosphatase isoform X2 n=1 Tax=Monomorium pharaonis TaxID=307658 RepID=UPI0017473C6A|nr:prostatic acid phosphatase isoform X2 [Monomorium pharaonis]